MRWFTRSPRKSRPDRNAARADRRRVRPQVEALEDRCLLATASGTITGFAFVDANANGVRDTGDTTVPGIAVSLIGNTTGGNSVAISATTDASGAFSFLNVPDGTYKLGTGTTAGLLGNSTNFGGSSAPPGGAIVNVTMTDGATISQDLGFRGLDPAFISLRMFLTNTTQSSFPFPAAGNGQVSVEPRANNAPVVANAIATVNTVVNSRNTVIDLAGVFTDPDITDTQVRFNTSMGAINVELFNTKAPRTVANFLNYVTSGAYNNSIFHRLVQGFVIQGGGFTFQSNPSKLTPIPTDPPVQNEFGTSNTIGTLAMAKLGGDPNSATDQFFFNLADNSQNLDNQNGGFTVFGKIDGPSDQAVLSLLSAVQPKNEGSPFDQIPLLNHNGTNFPTDTTAANYELLSSVQVVSQTETLKYGVVGNTNPNLVFASVDNNRLTLQYVGGQTGTATITVRAQDSFGAFVDTSFTVNVVPGIHA